MKHSEYINIISVSATDSLKNALIKGVIKNLPFLSTGIPNVLLAKLAGHLASWAMNEAEMRIFFKYIDFRTDAQAKDFEAAMIYNHTIQKIGTDDEKAKAELGLRLALERLVNLSK